MCKELGPNNEMKLSHLLKNLVDSYTRLNFFEVKHGFIFFPKALSKYFRSRPDKLKPLFLSQFTKLLKEQEILHFQKIKTANECFNFTHFLAKFCQMKVIQELLENSLDKMTFKSFRFLGEFVELLKNQKLKDLNQKQEFENSKNSLAGYKIKSLSNQLFDIMRLSFSINKKHNKFQQYILLPLYISGKSIKKAPFNVPFTLPSHQQIIPSFPSQKTLNFLTSLHKNQRNSYQIQCRTSFLSSSLPLLLLLQYFRHFQRILEEHSRLLKYKFWCSLKYSFQKISLHVQTNRQQLESELISNSRNIKIKIKKIMNDADQTILLQFQKIKDSRGVLKGSFFPTEVPIQEKSSSNENHEKLNLYLDRIHNYLLLLKYLYRLKFNVNYNKMNRLKKELDRLDKESYEKTSQIVTTLDLNLRNQIQLSKNIEKFLFYDQGKSEVVTNSRIR